MELIVVRYASNSFKPDLKPTFAARHGRYFLPKHYLNSLMQAHQKNMERMEEWVAGAAEQRLQHLLTESPWEHRAVLDEVAQEADR